MSVNLCLMFRALLIFEASNKLLKFPVHTVQGMGESHAACHAPVSNT